MTNASLPSHCKQAFSTSCTILARAALPLFEERYPCCCPKWERPRCVKKLSSIGIDWKHQHTDFVQQVGVPCPTELLLNPVPRGAPIASAAAFPRSTAKLRSIELLGGH